MKQKVLLLTVIAAMSLFLIVLLHLNSLGWGQNKRNGFTRKFVHNAAFLTNKLDLQYNSYYLAGAGASTVYIANKVTSDKLLLVENNMRDTSYVTLSFSGRKYIAWAGLSVTVDSPCIFVTDLLSSAFYFGQTENYALTAAPYFDRATDAACAISTNIFITRRFDTSLKQNDLSKIPAGGNLQKPVKPILTSQQDGIFSTDGMLVYDQTAATLIYLYYYRNQYLHLDTNLNIINEARTIDTVTTANIQIARIASTNSRTLTGTPTIINARCAADNGRLYIHSLRRADNQTDQRTQSVIDVYDLLNHKYLYSFYLPVPSIQLKSFLVKNNTLYVIADRKLMAYRLSRNAASGAQR